MIFEELGRRNRQAYEIEVSFYEIYKDQVLDLLAEKKGKDAKVVLRENARSRVLRCTGNVQYVGKQAAR